MFQNFVNITYGYSDPKDPAKQSTVVGKRGKFTAYNGYRGLDRTLQEMVAAGTLQDRDDLIAALKENNIEVIDITADYLEIQIPKDDSNGKQAKPRKLQGHGIYTDRFTSFDELSDIAREQAQRERAFAGRRDRGEGREIGARLAESIRKRGEFNQARFRPKESKNGATRRRDETRQPEVAREIEASPGQRPITRESIDQSSSAEQREPRSRNKESVGARKNDVGSVRRDSYTNNLEDLNDRIRSTITRYVESRKGRKRSRTRRSSERAQRISLYTSIDRTAATTDYRTIAEAHRQRKLRSYIAESVKQLPNIFNRVTRSIVERVREIIRKPIDQELFSKTHRLFNNDEEQQKIDLFRR
jgi:hypothetical protein